MMLEITLIAIILAWLAIPISAIGLGLYALRKRLLGRKIKARRAELRLIVTPYPKRRK